MKTRISLAFLIAVLFTPIITQAQQITDEQALTHARHLLKTVPLIDGHNDLPWVIRADDATPMNVEAYDLRKKSKGDTDIERLKKGQVGAQFWSVYIPSAISSGHTKAQLEQIDIALRMIEMYPEAFELALTADDITRIFTKGKIASLLGIEGGKAIENSLGALRVFYRLGVRYMTLTHNFTSDWADASSDSAIHGGLSPFGEEVIREMNRLGMIPDLSHVSDETMSDVITLSQTPVIFSHSSARTMANHKRNVPDSILARLPANGGMVMVTVIPNFTSQELLDWSADLNRKLSGVKGKTERELIRKEYIAKNPEPRATLRQVADHIDYIRSFAGPDHVGIGADYFAENDVADGMEDVSCYPYLFAELIKRGWTDEDLKKLAGENMLRVMRITEQTAARLQKISSPSILQYDK